MAQFTVPAAKQKTYPTDSCLSCNKHLGEAHYAGSLVWHIPSEDFSHNYIAYTVKLGGPRPECDCTHGEYARESGKPATCKHVERARVKEALRTARGTGDLFGEDGDSGPGTVGEISQAVIRVAGGPSRRPSLEEIFN